MPSKTPTNSKDLPSSSILIPEGKSNQLSLEPLPVTKILFLSLLKKYPQSSGYDLMNKVTEFSHNRLSIQSGTIYPALRELEKLNLVSSELVSPGRRKRRIYTLTSEGELELSFLAKIIRKRMDLLMRPLLELLEDSSDS
jgi:DNA-binding PadR family transcriptional regulator